MPSNPPPDRVAIGTGRLDLVPSLLFHFLHPMLLIVGNGCGERHGPRHVEVSEGDNEYFSLFRRYDMAHDATFVAGIRQVGHGVALLIRAGMMLSAQLVDQPFIRKEYMWAFAKNVN